MDYYMTFAKRFFEATGIPAVLISNGRVVYASLAELVEFQPQTSVILYEPRSNPEFTHLSSDLEYGHVRIEGSGYDLFLGPVFSVPINEDLIREFFKETNTPPEYHEALTEQLYGLPITSHPQFIRYLLFLHLCLNRKEADVESFYAEENKKTENRGTRIMDITVEAKENENFHNSYTFEMELYHYIQMGDTGRLKRFLEKTQSFPSEGKTARTPLRHAKNTFIGLAAKAGVLGAIPGGVDAEKVYQLMDLYMMECELMQTIEEVHRLQYIMLMDFTQRCGTAKFPKGISAEIHHCMTYIQNHTNGSLGVDDVAEQIHRSSSYLMRHFKSEVGMSVGDYITRCKLEEACELLVYGNYTLAEISAYLGYSSQSYFQNVFKKQYGITPMQYKKRKSKGQINLY